MTAQIDNLLTHLRSKKGIDVKLARDITNTLGHIPSGSLKLDLAMGGRGYPRPKVIQIYGAPSSGKSLLTLTAEAAVTQAGKYVLHCDLENNYDAAELNSWRDKFGIDMDYVIHIPAQPAADVINTVFTLLKEQPDDIWLIVIDSISALTTEKLLDKNADDGYIDETPKMMSIFLRKLLQINKSATVLLISHSGVPIGSFTPVPQPKGGMAAQYYSAIRLEVKGGPEVDSKNEYEGAKRHIIDVNVKKNKVSAPGKRALQLVFDFQRGGFDQLEELIQLGEQSEVIKTGGPWYYFASAEDQKWKGKAEFRRFLEEHPETVEWLFQQVTGFSTLEYYLPCSL